MVLADAANLPFIQSACARQCASPEHETRRPTARGRKALGRSEQQLKLEEAAILVKEQCLQCVEPAFSESALRWLLFRRCALCCGLRLLR